MTEQELVEIIKLGREEQNIEYKSSMPWTDTGFAEKIIRTILSMSNIRDGGFILIGMEEQDDGSYVPAGISSTDKATFNEDNMADKTSEFADPYVNFYLWPLAYDGKEFLIVQVNEFDEIPVICKKDGTTTNLVRGKMYTRSRRKPESIAVPGQTEMREILDVAIEKGIRKFFSRTARIGIEVETPDSINENKFDEQIKDLS